MKRREQVERAARQIHIRSCEITSWQDCREFRGRCVRSAEAALDALLPQVTTVEELEALPDHTKVLDVSGEVFRKWRWDSESPRFYGTQWAYGPYAAGDIAVRGPLTVVWQP